MVVLQVDSIGSTRSKAFAKICEAIRQVRPGVLILYEEAFDG